MIVRIRLRLGAARAPRRADRQTALVLSSLMTPLALMAWVLGGWRLAADLKWTGSFAIADGVFSHWQVWIALGIGVQFAAFLLHRYAARDEDNDAAVG
jgi:hypothetical protein